VILLPYLPCSSRLCLSEQASCEAATEKTGCTKSSSASAQKPPAPKQSYHG